MAMERSPDAHERPLDAPLMVFDLPAVIRQLQSERTWETGSRNAMTLLKSPELRVVLVAMHTGAEVPWQPAEASMTIQVVQGRLVVSAESRSETLSAGQLVALHAGVSHRLEAKEPCAFVLTLVTENLHPAE
ncbi:MAG TPA: hypothetical protein VFD92_23340 [Candidatus Binatia bacterium]|nr:hypothetical protein [Candidatus Binatia bacterium]